MIDASSIILGFTGSIGSGCSYVSSFLPEVADSPYSYKYVKVSGVIRNELTKEGIVQPTISQLQDKGNELRKGNNPGYLIELLIKDLIGDTTADDDDDDPPTPIAVIIDGIKNIYEIKTLRQFPNFFLFSIQAPFDVRKERVVGENKPFANDEEFKAADERDRLEKDDEFGQQVKKCNYLADIIILNPDNFPQVDEESKKKFIRGHYDKYCKLIENLREENASPSIPPGNDELCMSIAYAQSKMSSCLKRKVGAVIVDTIKSSHRFTNNTGRVTEYPVVVSSGYNEVPLGSKKCIYHPEFEKCYRDYLQEAHAKKISHCPKCGKKLEVTTYCPYCNNTVDGFRKFCQEHSKEIDNEFICEDCGCSVFTEFLPGEKETPGKLLDMCRALHAEENALLNLLKTTLLTETI